MTYISGLFRLLHSGCEIRTALHICATVARRGNFGRDGDHRHSADAALCRTLPPLSGSYYRVHLNWMGESRDQIGRASSYVAGLMMSGLVWPDAPVDMKAENPFRCG